MTTENLLAALDGKKDEDSVWVENLLEAKTVYRSDKTKDKYEMEPFNLVGSIIPMPVKVAKESYLRRAVLRGKVRFLSNEEESKRSAELIFRDETVAESNFMKALEEGASDSGSRYTKQNLPEDAEERGSWTARQIWEGRQQPTTVKRSEGSTTAPDPDAPVEISYVMTEPVKEGEWQSDTGI